jgi:hypothetical protein
MKACAFCATLPQQLRRIISSLFRAMKTQSVFYTVNGCGHRCRSMETVRA